MPCGIVQCLPHGFILFVILCAIILLFFAGQVRRLRHLLLVERQKAQEAARKANQQEAHSHATITVLREQARHAEVANKQLEGEVKPLRREVERQRRSADELLNPDAYDIVLDFDTITASTFYPVYLSSRLIAAVAEQLRSHTSVPEDLVALLAGVLNLKDRGIVALTGFFNKGKTFIANRLANDRMKLPSDRLVHTKGLSLVLPDCAKHIFLDTASNSAPSKGGAERDMLDKKCTEEVIRSVVAEVTDISIVVVDELTWEDQQLIWNVKRGNKYTIIIHKWFHATSEEECLSLWKRDVLAVESENDSFTDWIGPPGRQIPVLGKCGREPFVRHVFLAQEGSPAGDRYNDVAFDTVRSWLDGRAMKLPDENVFERLLSSLQRNLQRYCSYANARFQLVPKLSSVVFKDWYDACGSTAADLFKVPEEPPLPPPEALVGSKAWTVVDRSHAHQRAKERNGAALFVCTNALLGLDGRDVRPDAAGIGTVLTASGPADQVPYDVVTDGNGKYVLFHHSGSQPPRAGYDLIYFGTARVLCLVIVGDNELAYRRDGKRTIYSNTARETIADVGADKRALTKKARTDEPQCEPDLRPIFPGSESLWSMNEAREVVRVEEHHRPVGRYRIQVPLDQTAFNHGNTRGHRIGRRSASFRTAASPAGQGRLLVVDLMR